MSPFNEQRVDPLRAAFADIATWSATIPVWQRDALRRIYADCDLSAEDIEELELLCRQAHHLTSENDEPTLTPRVLSSSDVPAIADGDASAALKAVSHPQNVNALATDQTLNFSLAGLTIIYGDNGVGKSGYTRVLKRACRARDQEDILADAYGEQPRTAPTATIRYAIGNVEQPEVRWQDGSAAPDSLSEISVFDSKCALIHVDATNELAYTPIPLRLLETLAQTALTVSSRLRKACTAVETQIPGFKKNPQSRPGTAVTHFLETLGPLTPPSLLATLTMFSEQEKESMTQLKSDLSADPSKRIPKVEAARTRVVSLIETVKHAERIISDETIDEFKQLLRSAKETLAAAKLAACKAFDREPLPEIGTAIWRRLWEAAREFSTQAYPQHVFPNVSEGAVCLLCQAQLSQESSERLARFEAFVQAKAQQLAEEAKRKLEAFQKDVAVTISKQMMRDAVILLRDDLERPKCCTEVVRCLAMARARLRTLFLHPTRSDHAVPVRQSTASTQLAQLVVIADERLAQLRKSLNPKEKIRQQKLLHEFEDRVWLATVSADVEAEIARLKQIRAYDAAIRDTDTSRITRKATELSRSLVTDRLRDAFASEISALGLSDRRIELAQDHSGYGSAKFRVSLIRNPEAQVARVLSEGEQSCVALAAFLSELATAANKSGVIFDDPVSSLDHMYRDAVVRRLVQEAKEGRQVIIFTHDITFLVALDDEARRRELTPFYQSISRSEKHAGICAEGSPTKAKPITERLNKIKQRIDDAESAYSSGKSEQWAEEVKLITGLLRDVWELALEKVVAPVLRRHSNKIRPSGLRKLVVITQADYEDFNEGYAFCCTYCHTDSTSVNRPAPTPEKLINELRRARGWLDTVSARQEKGT